MRRRGAHGRLTSADQLEVRLRIAAVERARRPLRRVLCLVLKHHAHGPLADLCWVSAWSCHRSILSRTGASNVPGAVQFALEAFGDPDEDVRQSLARIQSSLFVPRKDRVRGFVFEVETGRLREIT